MSSIPANVAQRPLFNPGVNTALAVNTLLNADRISGDGDQNLGRGEMLRYGDYMSQQVSTWNAWHQFLDFFGFGFLVENQLREAEAEQQRIAFIIDHAADFSGADGNGATISAKDIQLVAARDGNAATLSGVDFKPFTPQPGGNREQQLRDYFNSPAFKNLNLSPSESIRMLYTIVLERQPDRGGQQFWEGQLQNGMPLSGIVEAFINSPEYKERFGLQAA